MRILHTSDWHLGQPFYGYDRFEEHHAFLNWLVQEIAQRQPDVLLVAGDIFDSANPSAAAQKQLYQFIQQAKHVQPTLQSIFIAGNHDSPARMEAPEPILSALGVSMVGSMKRTEEGEWSYASCVIPLEEKGRVAAYCVALPFLRPSDVNPFSVLNDRDAYTKVVQAQYEAALAYAKTLRGESKVPLLAMGHLHLTKGVVSEDSERKVCVGGSEALPDSIFNEDFAYVALGHLHRPQKVGRETVRYSGSPLPLSFSELRYPHQVVQIEWAEEKPLSVEPILIPETVKLPLVRLPDKHEPLDRVLEILKAYVPEPHPTGLWPFVEVWVSQESPLPHLRAEIEAVLKDKPLRLARIDVKRVGSGRETAQVASFTQKDLNSLNPEKVFESLYQKTYSSETVPDALLIAFRELVGTLSEQQDKA